MDEPPDTPIPLDQGLEATLGFELDEIGDGFARAHFAVENRVRQPFGLVHGGVHAAIAETLASVGTFHGVSDEGKIVMGMSNNTTFLRSVTSGTVSAAATALHQGRTTWVWDVEMTDDSGRRCAISRVTIAVRERRS
jgi:1,4-dihydroxy-2-naphthoyl-CoA hydrolase